MSIWDGPGCPTRGPAIPPGNPGSRWDTGPQAVEGACNGACSGPKCSRTPLSRELTSRPGASQWVVQNGAPARASARSRTRIQRGHHARHRDSRHGGKCRDIRGKEGEAMPRWRALPDELDSQVREFAGQLRRLVDRSGLSIAAVADRTGYSKTSWERYLNGRLLAPKGAIVALAEVTGTNPVHLTTMWELAERAWSRSEMRHDMTMEAIRISQARAALGETGASRPSGAARTAERAGARPRLRAWRARRVSPRRSRRSRAPRARSAPRARRTGVRPRRPPRHRPLPPRPPLPRPRRTAAVAAREPWPAARLASAGGHRHRHRRRLPLRPPHRRRARPGEPRRRPLRRRRRRRPRSASRPARRFPLMPRFPVVPRCRPVCSGRRRAVAAVPTTAIPRPGGGC